MKKDDMQLPKHLGGHKGRTHTDQGVLKYFYNHRGCKSVLDIGCGPGGQIEIANQLGYHTHGIDGDWTVTPPELFDFTQDEYVPLRQYDLAWSIEFLEHVEEQFVPNYMPAFKACTWAVVTHALPGEPGHHHVNCQPTEYWLETFSQHGFEYCEDETSNVRAASTMSRDFIRRRGLVFFNQMKTKD